MGTYGDLSGPMATYRGLWAPMGTYGDLWGPMGWLVGWLLPRCPGARPGPPRLQATGGRSCVTRCMSHVPRALGLARAALLCPRCLARLRPCCVSSLLSPCSPPPRPVGGVSVVRPMVSCRCSPARAPRRVPCVAAPGFSPWSRNTSRLRAWLGSHPLLGPGARSAIPAGLVGTGWELDSCSRGCACGGLPGQLRTVSQGGPGGQPVEKGHPQCDRLHCSDVAQQRQEILRGQATDLVAAPSLHEPRRRLHLVQSPGRRFPRRVLHQLLHVRMVGAPLVPHRRSSRMLGSYGCSLSGLVGLVSAHHVTATDASVGCAVLAPP